MNSKPTRNSKWLTDIEVGEETGYGRTSVRDFTNPRSGRYRPDFPKGITLGLRRRRWLLSEIRAYVASLIATNNDTEIEGES